MHGQQINYQYCFNAETCESDTFFPTDTIQTSFTTRVYVVWDKKDTLRFTGIEGADIAVRERFVNIGPPADTNCGGDAQCAYANYSDNKLEFRFDAYGSAYFGTGTLDDGTLELQTYFEYRSARIGYELEGAKIKDVQ